MNPNLLIVVARSPAAGTTKTRLGATIGADRACALYRAFLADVAARFAPAPGRMLDYDFAWGFTPAEADFRGALAALTGRVVDGAAVFVAQDGNTLNDRLTNLFRWGFDRGHRRVAIMASDSPQLPLRAATEAFSNLGRNDVTIGRVADGGYYLVGLSRFSDLLIDLPMSTSNAADAVFARATGLGLRFGEITPSCDVDEAADLRLLYAALLPDGSAAPATWAAFHRLGLTPYGLSGAGPSVFEHMAPSDD
jgi:glycosyltransferase A (GT-A) superfamily protein (DUF2064 family)